MALFYSFIGCLYILLLWYIFAPLAIHSSYPETLVPLMISLWVASSNTNYSHSLPCIPIWLSLLNSSVVSIVAIRNLALLLYAIGVSPLQQCSIVVHLRFQGLYLALANSRHPNLLVGLPSPKGTTFRCHLLPWPQQEDLPPISMHSQFPINILFNNSNLPAYVNLFTCHLLILVNELLAIIFS